MGGPVGGGPVGGGPAGGGPVGGGPVGGGPVGGGPAGGGPVGGGPVDGGTCRWGTCRWGTCRWGTCRWGTCRWGTCRWGTCIWGLDLRVSYCQKRFDKSYSYLLIVNFYIPLITTKKLHVSLEETVYLDHVIIHVQSSVCCGWCGLFVHVCLLITKEAGCGYGMGPRN